MRSIGILSKPGAFPDLHGLQISSSSITVVGLRNIVLLIEGPKKF